MAEKFQLKLGGYPAGYDAAKHGPYDPARYYGKPDTPFLDLKLSEIPGWFSRRQKTPQALAGACSRGVYFVAEQKRDRFINKKNCITLRSLITSFWRWQHKYVQPRRSGIAPFFQVIFASMIVFYAMNYRKLRHHKNYKYH